MNRCSLALLLTMGLTPSMRGQMTVVFPVGTGADQLSADLYGTGPRAVVLAHGGRFHKESWNPQAKALADRGFLVLALAFRGEGSDSDGSPGTAVDEAGNAADVLAAIHYLQGRHATEISAVGASFGGDAVGNANVAEPGALTRIVILGSDGGSHPEQLNGRKLFIVARDDRSGSGPRLPTIRRHYKEARAPKRLILLRGSAHAQFLFATDQGPRLLREIEHFLSAK